MDKREKQSKREKKERRKGRANRMERDRRGQAKIKELVYLFLVPYFPPTIKLMKF